MKFLDQCESLSELHVRDEHHLVIELFNNHEEILMQNKQWNIYKFNQREAIKYFE